MDEFDLALDSDPETEAIGEAYAAAEAIKRYLHPILVRKEETRRARLAMRESRARRGGTPTRDRNAA